MSISDQRRFARHDTTQQALTAERHRRIRAEQAIQRAKQVLNDTSRIPEVRIRDALREL